MATTKYMIQTMNLDGKARAMNVVIAWLEAELETCPELTEARRQALQKMLHIVRAMRAEMTDAIQLTIH